MIEKLELLKGSLEELEDYFCVELKISKEDDIDIANLNFSALDHSIKDQLYKISKYKRPIGIVYYFHRHNTSIIIKTKYVFIINNKQLIEKLENTLWNEPKGDIENDRVEK